MQKLRCTFVSSGTSIWYFKMIYSNNLMVAGERVEAMGEPCLHYICNNCGFSQRCDQPCVYKISFKAESR